MSHLEILLVSTPLAGDKLPGGVCPSLSNLTLGSHLRRAGRVVEVLDPSVDLAAHARDDPKAVLDAVADAVEKAAPRVLGLAALSPIEGRFAVALARRLKARGNQTPIVVGGIWATACAHELLARCPEIDAVVAGPGEPAAVMLAERGMQRPEEMPGLTWRTPEGIRQNPIARTPTHPAAVDLSLMAHPERYDIFCWLTSRGCPFHCTFCTEALTSPEYVHDPLDKVRAEITAFKEMDQDWYLWICDPLFGTKRDRLSEVCEIIGEANLAFLAESRVDVLKPEDIPKMAAAGCDLIYFGLEAASQRSLCELAKIPDRESRHRAYKDGARAVVEGCLRANIVPVFGILNPVPGDTEADLVETLDLVKELAEIPARLGPDANGIAPCFHAFPLRFDRGAPYDTQEARLREAGVTFSDAPDALFGDRFIADASPSINSARADEFRESIRACNPKDPAVLKRLWGSFPRPYIEFEV